MKESDPTDTQPWCVVEIWDGLPSTDFQQVTLVVGPFDDREKALTYMKWVKRKGGFVLAAVGMCQMIRPDAEFIEKEGWNGYTDRELRTEQGGPGIGVCP